MNVDLNHDPEGGSNLFLVLCGENRIIISLITLLKLLADSDSCRQWWN